MQSMCRCVVKNSSAKKYCFQQIGKYFYAKVEICRHGCLDHCQLSDSVAHYIQERKDQIRPQYIDSTAASIASGDDNSSADKDSEDGADEEQGDSSLYDDVIQNGDEVASIGGHFLDVEKSIPKAQAQTSNQLPSTAETQHDSEVPLDEVDLSKPLVVNVRQDTSHSLFNKKHIRKQLVAPFSGTTAAGDQI